MLAVRVSVKDVIAESLFSVKYGLSCLSQRADGRLKEMMLLEHTPGS